MYKLTVSLDSISDKRLGSEAADELTKRECTIEQTPSEDVCYKSVSSMIKFALRNLHRSNLKERIKEKLGMQPF